MQQADLCCFCVKLVNPNTDGKKKKKIDAETSSSE